jgi:hypothetical protein
MKDGPRFQCSENTQVSNGGRARPIAFPLRQSQTRYISSPMTRIFDMDDRARLPWRFHGATMTVLARL